MNYLQLSIEHLTIKVQEAVALVERVRPNDVILLSREYTVSTKEGPSQDIKVKVAFKNSKVQEAAYILTWDERREQFTVDVSVDKNLINQFMREFRRFKIESKSKQELFILLVKANRRRKSAERKVGKLRGRLRKADDDWLKGVGSRQRTIEQQWEVMRELQRRGLVTMEALEQVLWDVMKVRLPDFTITKQRNEQ